MRLTIHLAMAWHYNDFIMRVIASQITSLSIVCSSLYSGAGQRKFQSSASLAFVRGIHRWPVNSPHKWPVTRKMFPFDDVIKAQLAIIWTAVDPLYNETWTKLLPLCMRHVQMNVINGKYLYFDWNDREICSYGFNWQYAIIGSGTDLVPNWL